MKQNLPLLSKPCLLLTTFVLTNTVLCAMPTREQWKQIGHSTACITGVISSVQLWRVTHAQRRLVQERTHLLNNLLLAQPASPRQRANLVSRINQLGIKQQKLFNKLFIWGGIIGLHLLYTGAYLSHRFYKKAGTP